MYELEFALHQHLKSLKLDMNLNFNHALECVSENTIST